MIADSLSCRTWQEAVQGTIGLALICLIAWRFRP